MKLVASLIVHNEMSRFLRPCIEHLTAFCDEIRVLDDGSTDDTYEWIRDTEWMRHSLSGGGCRVECLYNDESKFFRHEGRARQQLLNWTLEASPTHILALDADEFVADGVAIRAAIDRDPAALAFTVEMQEVWKAWDECLCIRYDGGWAPTRSSLLYRVPPPHLRDGQWHIRDLALSSGREPSSVKRLAQAGKATAVATEVLHFGWTNELDRAARHQRYVVADNGRYHRSQHLASIVWPDAKVEMESREWPPALDRWRDQIVARGGHDAAVA